jgi:WD40 repeat protein
MTCSDDGSLRVWNFQGGEQIGDEWRDGNSRVNTVGLAPNGEKVASGSPDGAVRVWNVSTGKLIAKWTWHASYVASVCWNRDGGQVICGSYDGTARVWNVETGKIVLVIKTVLDRVEAVIHSPDEITIATAGGSEWPESEFIKIWDAKAGKLITKLKGHTDSDSPLLGSTDIAIFPYPCKRILGQDSAIMEP